MAQAIAKIAPTFGTIGVPRDFEDAVRLDDEASGEAGWRSVDAVGDGYGLALAALAVVLIVTLLVAATVVV